MIENLIATLRNANIDFFVEDNKVTVLDDDGFELTAVCDKDTIVISGKRGYEHHRGFCTARDFVDIAINWVMNMI